MRLTVSGWITVFLMMASAAGIAHAGPSFQNGICFAAWEKERYASAYSDKSLEMLAQTGATWVAVVTTYYQEKYNSKQIFPTEKTPSDRKSRY